MIPLRLTGRKTWHARSRRDTVLDVYNLFVAIFLFASPWLFAYSNKAALADLWSGGVLIGLVSATAIATLSDREEWLNLLLGVWLVLAPWTLGFAHARAAHVSVAGGCIVAYLAGLRLWLAYYRNPAEP